MRKFEALFIIVVVCAVLILPGCVKTEKRKTKKVDVSKAQILELAMDQPRIRVVLNVPAEIRETVVSMLSVHIDDGTRKYTFSDPVFAPQSPDSGSWLFSPWVNTPDSGLVVLAFSLINKSGMNYVEDLVTMPLRPDSAWEVEFGVKDYDPCPDLVDSMVCRSYALPRDIEASGNGQLYIVWHGLAVEPTAEAEK